jgi:hypothetical protein
VRQGELPIWRKAISEVESASVFRACVEREDCFAMEALWRAVSWRCGLWANSGPSLLLVKPRSHETKLVFAIARVLGRWLRLQGWLG